MVSPLVILLGLGLAAAAASGSSSRRRYAPASRRGMSSARVCTLPPSGVSLEDADEQDRWTRCAGRRFEDVQALAGRLTAAGRVERASAVIELYNRRRAVEDAPPDPGAVSPETRAEVDRAVSASDGEVDGGTAGRSGPVCDVASFVTTGFPSARTVGSAAGVLS